MLAHYERVFTNDKAVAEAAMSRMFCGHKLALSNSSDFYVRYSSVPVDDVSFNFFSYSEGVTVLPEPTDAFYLIHIPLGGSGVIYDADEEVQIRPGILGIQNPGSYRKNVWSNNCDRLVLRFSRASLEREASMLLDAPVRVPVRFAPSISTDHPLTGGWLAHLRSVLNIVEAADRIEPIMPSLRVYAKAIVTSLLVSVPNNYTERFNGLHHAPRPFYVKRAQDFIDAHYASNLTLEDLAAHTGYSIRSLTNGFNKYVGVSPKQYLTRVRLEAARTLLQDPRCAMSITEIAGQTGFSQLGRFAGLYKSVFNELPSETRAFTPGRGRVPDA